MWSFKFMETTFDAIVIEIKNHAAFEQLAEDVGKCGEISCLVRDNCSSVMRASCLKLGRGLEVWNVLYKSSRGKVFYSYCRPGFCARHA